MEKVLWLGFGRLFEGFKEGGVIDVCVFEGWVSFVNGFYVYTFDRPFALRGFF